MKRLYVTVDDYGVGTLTLNYTFLHCSVSFPFQTSLMGTLKYCIMVILIKCTVLQDLTYRFLFFAH